MAIAGDVRYLVAGDAVEVISCNEAFAAYRAFGIGFYFIGSEGFGVEAEIVYLAFEDVGYGVGGIVVEKPACAYKDVAE